MRGRARGPSDKSDSTSYHLVNAISQRSWQPDRETRRGHSYASQCRGNMSPCGTLTGKGSETQSRSILIDKGGNYISLAFSANPHGPAGDMKRETKRMRIGKGIMEFKERAKTKMLQISTTDWLFHNAHAIKKMIQFVVKLLFLTLKNRVRGFHCESKMSKGQLFFFFLTEQAMITK